MPVLVVDSGDAVMAALTGAEAPSIDAIVLDLVMPGLTGYEVCEAVKKRAGGEFVPVVLLTGTFEPFDRTRAERVGSDAIVTKPFDSHALQGLVAPAAAMNCGSVTTLTKTRAIPVGRAT